MIRRAFCVLWLLLCSPVFAVPVYFSNDRNFDGTFNTAYEDGTKPPNTEWDGVAIVYEDDDIRIPLDSIPKSVSLTGQFDVWIRPVDETGIATSTEILLEDVEFRADMGANQVAFYGPGGYDADGYGRLVTGGRGGDVCFVTNTNDSGAGSLRACATTAGTASVIFNVSGTIDLASQLTLSQPNKSYYFQSAPGDGIQIIDERVTVAGTNTLIQYGKFRLGLDTGRWDTFTVATDNVIVDHSDINYGNDENQEIWGDRTDITFSNMINAYGLHCTGWSGSEPCHSKGILIGSQNDTVKPDRISYVRSIFHASADRYPLSRGQYQNWENILFSARSGTGRWSVFNPEDYSQFIHLRNNCYQRPAGYGTNPATLGFAFNAGDGTASTVYRAGNFVWDGDDCSTTAVTGATAGNFTVSGSPIVGIPEPNGLMTANAARAYTLANAGARCPSTDALTQLVLDQIVAETSNVVIDDEDENGVGFPTHASSSHPGSYDADNDGLPDLWERYAGENGDLTQSDLRLNGLTNLENAMHDLAWDCTIDGDLAWITFDDDPQAGDTDGYEVYIVAPGTPFDAGLPKDRFFRTVAP